MFRDVDDGHVRPPAEFPSEQRPRPAADPPGRDAGSIAAGERRIITVLFCDVVGSTSLASRLDPEEWAEVMNEAFQYMIAPIEEYGGMVARLMGDAVLAFFGAPQAHEDDPQRAVLAGLGIVNGIRPFIHQFQQDYGLEFNVRVGINTGPVVVGEIGTSQSGEYTAMGDAINMAARMEQTAAAGTVQISDDTYRLIAPLFDVWDLGGVEVKGKDEPVHAYRVLGLEPQPGRLRGLEGIHAPLVGRDREIGRLRDILAGLRDGRSTICYLIGEAGLGKSRLIAEVRQEWRDQLAAIYGDVNPLWRGWSEFVAVSFGASRPYDMLKRQVRNFCGIRETDTPEVIHERLNALVSLYPSALHDRMHHVFGFLLGDTRGDSFQADGEAFQRELRAVLEQMTQAQAALGPVVYVIDDVHWADVASLEAIRNLLPLVGRRPVLFLFAMRPDWSTPGWQLYLEAQLEYPEYCASIYLEPLSADDSRALVERLLGDNGVPQQLYDLIQRKTEGNPFFVEETVRTLIDIGALQRAADGLIWNAAADMDEVAALIGVPGNVQALLTARIDQLEPDVRRTLQLAAVIGRSFPLRVLERIADKPGTTLNEHLKRLGQADLVRPAATGMEAEYAFRHALTRDAAYETILIRQRRRYHRRVGETIETLYPDRLTDEVPRLAYHFEEARDWPRAVRYYTMAGEAAARLYANTEALDHFTRALGVCRANPASVDEAILADLYRRRGRVFEVAGRYDEALGNYEELERIGRERANPTLELEGLMPQAVIYVTPTRYMNAERGRELAQRMQALAERTGRADAEARAHWTRLLLYMNADPDMPRAAQEGDRALALAREHGLHDLEAFVLNDVGRAYAGAGRTDEAFAAFEQASRLWQQMGNEPMLADVLGIWSQGLLLRGDLNGAEQTARRGLAVAQRIGNQWALALNSFSLAYAQLERGYFGEAIGLFWTAAELALRAGFQGPGATIPVVLAWSLGGLGAPDYGRERLEAIIVRSEAERQFPVMWHLWRLIRRYLDGDAAGAFEMAAGLKLPPLFASGQEGVITAFALPTVAVAAGHPDKALALVDEVLAEIEPTDFAGLRDDAYQTRGDALRALGRNEEALAAYRLALDEARRQGARHVEWRALAALSELEPDPATAAAYRAQSAELIAYLAGQIDDPELRAAFLRLSDG